MGALHVHAAESSQGLKEEKINKKNHGISSLESNTKVSFLFSSELVSPLTWE